MDFKHIYLFLVPFGTFFEKFILNINNEHHKTALALASATINDPERSPMTLSFHLCHMETKQNAFGDR